MILVRQTRVVQFWTSRRQLSARGVKLKSGRGEASRGRPFFWGLMLFADSCRIIAMSRAELQRMARVLDELLQDAGLRIAWQEAVWCCSTTDTLDATSTVTDLEKHPTISGS